MSTDVTTETGASVIWPFERVDDVGLYRHLLERPVLTRHAGEHFTGVARWHIDLSTVEWIDVGSMVQLVLLIECALRAGTHVRVTPPCPEPGPVGYARRRALQFFDNIDVPRALDSEHLAALPGRLVLDAPVEDTPPRTRDKEKWIVPLTWLTQGELPREWRDKLEYVLRGAYKSLARIDADTLADVIIAELVDNVRHAGEGIDRALVGVVAQRRYDPESVHGNLPPVRDFVGWQVDTRVHTIEIIAGDSGKGIHHSLAPAWRQHEEPDSETTTDGAAEQRLVLRWSFQRRSSCDRMHERPGTRGLYRVHRVARKYCGLVTLRSGQALVGMDHGGLSYHRDVESDEPLPDVPGTIVHVRLTTALPPRSLKHQRPTIDRPHEVRLLAPQDILPSIADSDGSGEVCIVSTVRYGTDGLTNRRALEDYLRDLVESRHPGALILLWLSGSGWDVLASCADSINAEMERHRYGIESATAGSVEVYDPVLVVNARREWRWVGIAPRFEGVLGALVEAADGRIDNTRVQALLPGKAYKRDRIELLRMMSADVALVNTTPGHGLELRINLTGIAQLIGDRLGEALDDPDADLPGVLDRGAYLTPTLSTVRRWLRDVDLLIADVCGTGAALGAFALSLLCRNDPTLRPHLDPPPEGRPPTIDSRPSPLVVGPSGAASRNAEMLADALDLEFRELPGEAGRPLGLDTPLLTPDAPCIIYIDIVRTAESLKSLIKEVLRLGAEPVAAVTLFGAQPTGTFVEEWGRRLPVIALARIDLDLPATNTARLRAIRPYTTTPANIIEPPPDPQPREKTPEERMIDELIERCGALHVSHTGRDNGRHYTFFVDVRQLVRQPTFIEVFDARITAWTRNQGAAGRPLSLWYPAPKSASEATMAIVDALSGRRVDIVERRAVGRSIVRGVWRFEDIEPEPVGSPDVVLIDWGAVTGTTLLHMMAQAARAGAERILAMVFLSQLPPSDEAFLTSVRSVDRTEHRDPPPDRQPDLPLFRAAPAVGPSTARVEVQFIRETPFSGFEAHDCPVCRYTSALGREQPVPAALKRHRDHLLDHFRLKRRFTVAEGGDGVDEEATRRKRHARNDAMLAWRRRLRRALTSTWARHALAEDLSRWRAASHLSDVPQPAVSLVDLLAFESHWLRLPPLSFGRLRRDVALIAVEILCQAPDEGEVPLHAAIVLRIASKQVFADTLARTGRAVADRPRLLGQLLLDAFSFIARRRYSADVFDEIQASLKGLADTFEAPECTVDPELAQVTRRLVRRAAIARRHSEPGDMLTAWRSLTEIFAARRYRRHHPIPEQFRQLRVGMYAERIRRAMDAEPRVLDPRLRDRLKLLDGLWQECAWFLDHDVMPAVKLLRSVLDTDQARGLAGGRACDSLLMRIDDDELVSQGHFSRLVARISNEPDELLWDEELLPTYLNELDAWNQDIFYPGNQRAGRPPSGLIRLIDSAPTGIGRICTWAESLCEDVPDDPIELDLPDSSVTRDTPVFATPGLMAAIVRCVVQNVRKHRICGQRPRLEVGFERRDRWIVVVIRNSATEASAEPGVGLRRLRANIEGFGGRLAADKMRPDAGSPWTYLVEVSLLAWRPGPPREMSGDTP